MIESNFEVEAFLSDAEVNDLIHCLKVAELYFRDAIPAGAEEVEPAVLRLREEFQRYEKAAAALFEKIQDAQLADQMIALGKLEV